jgi:NAD(P)-dependent dehydrogenase (short-subunit alcohol dehydrogenase family)
MTGRVMLVTGGFGGLGTALGKAAGKAGYRVALVGRSEAPSGDFDALRIGGTDVGIGSGAEAAVGSVLAKFGQLDVLVNATGDFSVGTVADGDVNEWTRLFAAITVPAVSASKAAIPALMKSGAGRIINIGWVGGREGKAFVGAGSAAKAGIQRLTETLADELKGHRVTANAVLPTAIDTPRNRQMVPDADRSGWVTYDQVVTAILFLASPEASGISGAQLPVAPRG